MGHPCRSRTIALGFAASGVVALLAAFGLPPAAASDGVRTALFIYGGSAILFGGGTALFRHFDVRAMEKLARGEEVIARWPIEPAIWQEFIAAERQWLAGGSALPNELAIPAEVPEEGIDVIAGRNAVQIGESIHRLTSGMPEVTAAALFETHPAVIELQLYYPGGGAGASGVPRAATRAALRFPVGRGHWKEAAAVVAHYRGDSPRKPDFFHGKGDGSNPEDLTRCYNCGYGTYQLMSHCPQCGRGMQSKRSSRRSGVLLVVLGAFISGVIGLVLLAIGPGLLDSGAGWWRFSGTEGDAKLILGLLGLIEVFGFTVLVYGAWQIVTGRRSKWVIYFTIVLAAVLLLLTLLF